MVDSVGSFGSRPYSKKKDDSFVDSCGLERYAKRT